MQVTNQVLVRRLFSKAKELETTHDLLLCALQVIDAHKNMCDVIANCWQLDGYISYELTKPTIQQLTKKAIRNLMSKSPEKVAEGCREVEIINNAVLNSSPFYKAYSSILHTLIGDGPILQLHLTAVEMVAALSFDLRSRHKVNTITEVILNKCSEEVSFFTLAQV